MDKEKEQQAIERLKFFEPLNGQPYYLAYSGGKDSDVILALADMANVKFEAVHNLTTVDAPETVYHVRSKGVKIDKPERSMWQLIVDKRSPPTRVARYCCSYLKERGGHRRTVVTGVRKAESVARAQNGGLVKVIGKPKATMAKAEEMGVEYEYTSKGGIIINNNDNGKAREFVEHCTMQAKVLVNPIVDWTDDDVWEFLRVHGIKTNSLYECGYKRIGCIGCPMASKHRYKQFEDYPIYRANYVRAFDKMLKAREEHGNKPVQSWIDGEHVMRWWLEEDPMQIKFEDL